MVAAISQKTALIDQVVQSNEESIYDRLQCIINKFHIDSKDAIVKKQSLLLVSLEKQVEDHRTRVLRNTSLMFGSY